MDADIHVGLTGIETSFCIDVARTEQPLIVKNAICDPRYTENILVKGFPGIRFYAGVPVVGTRGGVAGVLCVVDYEPRDGLTPSQFENLADLANLAADQLALMRKVVPVAEWVAEPRGDAMLVVNGNADIVHWNSAAERLLAAYADDLFGAAARRHLPGWDDLAAGATGLADRATGGAPSAIALVRADGSETVAFASVTREGDSRDTRFRVLLRGSRQPAER